MKTFKVGDRVWEKTPKLRVGTVLKTEKQTTCRGSLNDYIKIKWDDGSTSNWRFCNYSLELFTREDLEAYERDCRERARKASMRAAECRGLLEKLLS